MTDAATAPSWRASPRAAPTATPAARPQAKLVSLDVMDDHGVARTSDVIAACQWILANKDKYNIRIANFSLHSANAEQLHPRPAGQGRGEALVQQRVRRRGCRQLRQRRRPERRPVRPRQRSVRDDRRRGRHRRDARAGNDDSPAPWSAWGYTLDGFAKPDVAAPGRYMVGPVPGSSSLVAERPDKVAAPGYIQLSGTSFSAPVVAAAAAQILARHPNLTPDQVKGALMASAKPVPNAPVGSVGVGEIQMNCRAFAAYPPNPNKALGKFVGQRPPRRREDLRQRQLVRRWPRAASPGTRSRGPTSPGRTSPGTTSPGRMSPGRRSPGPTSPGRTSPGRTCPGTTPPTRTRPRATRAATRTGTSSPRSRRPRSWPTRSIAPPEDTLPAAVASALDNTNSTSSSTDGTVPGP